LVILNFLKNPKKEYKTILLIENFLNNRNFYLVLKKEGLNPEKNMKKKGLTKNLIILFQFSKIFSFQKSGEVRFIHALPRYKSLFWSMAFIVDFLALLGDYCKEIHYPICFLSWLWGFLVEC